MKLFRSSVLCFSLFAGYAIAGSRIWQPPINDNAALQKRYFHVNPDANIRGYEATVWPDKTIRVCYKDKATKDKFHLDLMAAHQIWVRAGLGEDFKIEPASDADCADQQKLKDCLLVSTGNSLATTPGFPTEDSFRRKSGNRGPEMSLSDDQTIGMLSKVPNYAHELGHSIGLYHEHQNPNFWATGDQIKYAEGGTVFGPSNNNNWRCSNLKDYASSVIGLVVQNPRGQQTVDRSDLCKDWAYAKSAGFSAGEYLPMPASLGFSQPGKTGGDVDWKSIMIYPSGAGAIDGSGDPEDPRMPILLDHKGKRIPMNRSPSQLDIHAVRGMYGVKDSKGRQLLNKARNFPKIYDLSKGTSGCL